MLLFLLGIFQIGITFFDNESLQTSARDGARAGAIHTGSTVTQIQPTSTQRCVPTPWGSTRARRSS